MATCKNTQKEIELVAGPRAGTLQCPECGEVMNEDTTPIGGEDQVEFTVTFTRSVRVLVPSNLVPPGFTMPKRIRNLPDDLYDALIAAVPEALGQVNPGDFGEIESIADDGGDTSITD